MRDRWRKVGREPIQGKQALGLGPASGEVGISGVELMPTMVWPSPEIPMAFEANSPPGRIPRSNIPASASQRKAAPAFA